MNKEELLIEWEEIEAYKTLDGKPFDFGSGLIIDTSRENENFYWKMEQRGIEDALQDLAYHSPSKTRKKVRPNRYERKYAGRKRLKKIPRQAWWIIGFNEETMMYKRYYESGRKGFAKKQSNRKIRHTKDFATDGGGYRRLYDYWWSVL